MRCQIVLSGRCPTGEMFYCPLTDVCSMGRCLIVLLVGSGGLSLSSGGDVCFCTRECMHEDSMETPANIIIKMSTGTLGRHGRGIHQCAIYVLQAGSW